MRYRKVIESVEQNFGTNAVMSDSSKSIGALKTLLDAVRDRPETDVRILLSLKDARAFVSSMTQARKLSLRGQFSCFRWWQGANAQWLSFLQASGMPYHVVLYEALCLRTQSTMSKIHDFLELDGDSFEASKQLGTMQMRAHICAGNSDMVFRNRDEIRYDCRWFNQLSVNMLYGIAISPRRMNKQLLADHLGI
jgi:hypothetical protein